MRSLRLGLLSFAMFGCGGATSSSSDPSSSPPGEIVRAVGSVEMLVGSNEGLAVAAGDGLHVVRSGGTSTIPGGDYWRCDPHDLVTAMAVARDRVVIGRASCGIWSYADGDDARREIVVTTTSEASDGTKHVSYAWRNDDGSPRPRWNTDGLWMTLAAHGDTLFLCASAELRAGARELPPREIWQMSLDGSRRERLVSRGALSCDGMVADADSVYASSLGEVFRIDRASREVQVLAAYSPKVLRQGLVRTNTHLVWKETLLDGDRVVVSVARVPLRGGPQEALPATNVEDWSRLGADGDEVFLSSKQGVFGIVAGRETRLSSDWPLLLAGALGYVWWVRDAESPARPRSELVRLPSTR